MIYGDRGGRRWASGCDSSPTRVGLPIGGYGRVGELWSPGASVESPASAAGGKPEPRALAGGCAARGPHARGWLGRACRGRGARCPGPEPCAEGSGRQWADPGGRAARGRRRGATSGSPGSRSPGRQERAAVGGACGDWRAGGEVGSTLFFMLMREWGLSVFTLRREPPPFIHPHGPSRCRRRRPGPRLRATSRPAARPRGGDGPPRRPCLSTEPRARTGPGGPRRTPGLGPRAGVARRLAKMVAAAAVSAPAPPPAQGNLLCAKRSGGGGGTGGRAGAAGRVGLGPLGAGVGRPSWRARGPEGARGGGGPGPGEARPAHTMALGRLRTRPAAVPGAAGAGRGARPPCGESFSRGRELKRLQNKAAAAHGAGRGPGGGAPTRNLRAGGVGGRHSASPKLCARRAGLRDAGAAGRRGRGATPRSAWALCAAAWAAPLAGEATPAVRPGGPGRPGPPSGRRGAPDGRWLRARRGRAGRVRQERRPRRHVPAGRAARAEGGGGGDMAATARRRRLFPA